jgi:tripartite-type tricarboxylate transporter receptor subunit TctC
MASPRAAAGWPTRPVRIIVSFTPGGSTDILARAIAQKLQEVWGQPFVVENRPGAGGSIGATEVARAAPDGHTLLMGHIGTLAVNPTLYPNLPYDPRTSFAPVALVAHVPNVLVVNPAMPAKSMQELIALAKAKPGSLRYASGGNGSAAHIAMEYFKLSAQIDIGHVPYKGTSPANVDLVAVNHARTRAAHKDAITTGAAGERGHSAPPAAVASVCSSALRAS